MSAITGERSPMRGILPTRQTSNKRPFYIALALVIILIFLASRLNSSANVRKHKAQDKHDIFANFYGRNTCGFGALDVHSPVEPMCQNTTELLAAMSDGGRGGFDAPYMPRGCDLRFYDSAEICDILSRFEGLILYGDSLMRHLTSAFGMLLRENLEFGGQLQWLHSSMNNPCLCDGQTMLLGCHQADIKDLDDVYARDPDSIPCKKRLTIKFEPITKWPIDESTLAGSINDTLKKDRPTEPYAFVFGHGLWNDMGQFESMAWVDQVQAMVKNIRPYFNDPNVFFPRIFVTPSAAGELKNDKFIQTQGNKAIMTFEKFMRHEVPARGLDFFGTYNMSVQATIPDGTHSGIRVNILKAMTILNWLDMQDVEKWTAFDRGSLEQQHSGQS